MAAQRSETEKSRLSQSGNFGNPSASQQPEHFGWVVRAALEKSKQPIPPVVEKIARVISEGQSGKVADPTQELKPTGLVLFVDENGVHPYREFPSQPRIPRKQTENTRHTTKENVVFRSGRRQVINYRGYRNKPGRRV